MLTTPVVVGLDVGHSAVKVAMGPSNRQIFRSLAVPAIAISDEHEAARAARETVEVNGRPWFFGETAEVQGGGAITTGLSDEWVETPEHTALLKGALSLVSRHGMTLDAKSLLVLGLPVRLFKSQGESLKQIASDLTEAEIKVVPQPIGPYHSVMLDMHGRPHTDRSMRNESWAVIDVGYYTTDFLLMMNGRWVEKASGSAKGVHVAAEAMQRALKEKGIEVDLPDCEAAMQSKTVRHFGIKDVTADVDLAASLVVSEVIDTAERFITPYVRKLDGVVLAGGGAPLLAQQLKTKWPTVLVPEHPRFAVAEGLRRLGEGILLARLAQEGTR